MGPVNDIRVSHSAVTGRVSGRVLSFTLTAGKPDDIVQGVVTGSLGVDLCRKALS